MGSVGINKKANIKSIYEKMNKYASEMETILANREHSYDTPAQKYYDIQAKFNKARQQYNEMLNEQVNTTNNPQSKTFVNSFGEATQRYVTSSAYERQQRRLNKEILSRLK